MGHPPQVNSPTILNVDDNDAMRYARSRTLTAAGYGVIDASTGEEALLITAALRPQLVVLDVSLPGTSGLEVCKQIKSDPQTAYIMVLQVSSSGDAALEVTPGLDGGADAYLVEPTEPLELLATVRALLRFSEQQAENRRLVERICRLERQFAEATDAADCGMWDWDIRTGKLEWFGAHERLAGLRSGGFSGKIEGFADILHGEDRMRVWQKLQDLMARRETQFEDEHRFIHPDGSVHWMLGIGRFFYDEQGQAVRMTGVVQDITKRKLIELRQQLESERRRLLACAAEQLLVGENPKELMTGVFETVRRHLDLDGYFHYRVDESGSALALETYAGVSEGVLPGSLDFGQALCGTTAQRRQPVIYERLHEVPDEKIQEVKALGFQAYACYPLIVGDRLLGTLAFASQFRNRFEPDEIAFMQSICRYVAAAMNRLRLEAETKERAERLHQSEEHLRIAMELNPQIPWTARPDGSLKSIHDRWLQLSGLTVEHALDDSWMRLQHEKDLPRMMAAWTHSIRTGEPYDIEHRVRPASGGYRWMRSRAFPWRDGEGRILLWYGTTEDVHDRKLAEEELRASEERLRLAQSAATIGTFDWDIVGDHVLWSPELEQIWGLPVGGFGGTYDDWRRQIHPDDLSEAKALVQRALTDPAYSYALEHRIIRPDKTVRWIYAKATTLWDEFGRPVRMVGINMDITERKGVEERLKEQARLDSFSARIGKQLIESRDLAGMLRGCTQTMVDDLDAAFARIWTLNEQDNVLELKASSGLYTNLEGRHARVPLGSLKIGLIAAERKPNLTNHVIGDPRVPEQEWARREGMVAFAGYPLVIQDRVVGVMAMFSRHALSESTLQAMSMVADHITLGIQRKRAEQALRESEEQLRLSLDASLAGTWSWDIATNRSMWDQRYHDLYGFEAQESPSFEAWISRVHPADRERLLARVQSLLTATGDDTWSEEFRAFHPLKGERWMHGIGCVERNETGKAVRFAGINLDVTDRKMAGQALAANEQRMRFAMQAACMASWDWDVLTGHAIWSELHFTLLGYEPNPTGEGSLEMWASRVHPDDRDRVMAEIESAKREHRLYRPEFRAIRADNGQIIWLSATGQFFYDEHGAAVRSFGVFYDISDRKRHEDQLSHWKDELEARVGERTRDLMTSQERLRELASQLSLTEERERRKLASDLHDYLAQMLVVGRMKINQMRKEVALPPEAEAVVQDVDSILQQVLAYTRTMIVELTPPSLHSAGLPESLSWLAERMQKDGLWVEVHANREEVPIPEDQAVMLFHAVRELLFNVLKHAGVDRATVRLTVGEAGDLSVMVEDRGKGFSADAMQRANEPGHLGLFSVRERMEAMGGRFEVVSTSGQGTTVTLLLPSTTR